MASLGLGYVEGVTHNYIRHGTTALFASPWYRQCNEIAGVSPNTYENALEIRDIWSKVCVGDGGFSHAGVPVEASTTDVHVADEIPAFPFTQQALDLFRREAWIGPSGSAAPAGYFRFLF